MKTKLRKNDEVIVIAGSYKGTKGTILKVLPKQQRVQVKGVNVVTKHVKPSQSNSEGSIQNFEAPIHISNVAYVHKSGPKDKSGIASKISYEKRKDKKS